MPTEAQLKKLRESTKKLREGKPPREMGRPLEWTPELIREYADNLLEWIDRTIEEKKMFWWKDWCFEVGILPNKAAELATKDEYFHAAYERARSIQSSYLAKGATVKKFDSNFTKFFLINQHKDEWKEKVVEEKEERGVTKEDIRELVQEISRSDKFISRINKACGSHMETQQPILDQGCNREKDSVQTELGAN